MNNPTIRPLFAFCQIISLFLIVSSGLFAQGNPAATEENLRREAYLEQNIVIPPSPQAASLGQYGNVEVSPYTGSVNFGLGVHTIQGKHLSAPIAMSYSGNGNKVSALPTWVGLGWTLQAGGVVTRATQGDPDFNENYYDNQAVIDGMHADTDILNKYDDMEDAIRFNIETQPDIYFYNFPGHSGKLYITPSKEVIFKEKTGLTVVVTFLPNGDISKFVFTDDMGIKYTLDRTEYTYYHTDDEADAMGDGTPPRAFTYNSSWHLSTMTTPQSSEEIVFSYNYLAPGFSLPSTNFAADTYSYGENYDKTSCGDFICGNPDVASIQLGGGYSLLEVHFRRFLQKIELKRNGTVIERATFNTTDYTRTWGSYSYTNKRLDAIVITQTPGLDSYDKTHHFEYYSTSSDVGRLTLKSYRSPSHETGQGYEFEYNSTDLPNVQSLDIDHWGYYNNNPSSSSLVPSVDLCGRVLAGGGANRDTDATRVKAGMLEKISYPTGGYSEMEYEPHMIKEWRICPGDGYSEIAGGGVRIKKVRHFSDGSSSAAVTKEYKYTNSANLTTGILMVKPRYQRRSVMHTCFKPCQGCGVCEQELNAEKSCPRIYIGSNSLAPLGAVQGSYVGYTAVEEINAGKTIYRYHNEPLLDNFADEHKNGKIDSIEIYDGANKLLAKTVFEYEFDNDSEITAAYLSLRVVSEELQSDERLCVQTNGSSSWVCPHQTATNCTNSGGTLRVIKTRLKTEQVSMGQKSYVKTAEKVTQFFYNSGGTQTGSLTREKSFEYDNKQTRNPTAIEFTDSKGEVRRTEIQYPLEIFQADNTDPSGGGLLLSNMRGFPVITEYFEDGTRIYRQRVRHKSFTQASGYLVEEFQDRYQGASDRTREVVEYRDAHANITQSKTLTDQPVSYLYNYRGSAMVATIQNAVVEQCAFTSFETHLDHGGWQVSNATDGFPYHVIDDPTRPAKVGLGSTRANTLTKSGLPAGNYIVSYWTKSPASVTLNSGTQLDIRQTPAADAEGWYFVERKVSVPTLGSVQLGISNYTDEVRLYPADGLMKTFTYERYYHHLVGTGDERGMVQRFEYDDKHRLKGVKDFEGNFLQLIDYHFSSGGNNYINHVSTKSPLIAGKTTEADVNATSYTDLMWSNAFVDGLGRPLQSVAIQESPTSKDIIVPNEFDSYGRQVREYLPYTATSSNGAYHSGALSAQSSFYTAEYGSSDGNKAYNESVLETSPLSRPIAQKIAGSTFQLHPNNVTYRANTTNEVRYMATANAYYPANQLLVIETVDGDGRTSRQFISKSGRKIREDMGNSKTYYEYDGVGNILTVVQPEGSAYAHAAASRTYSTLSVHLNAYEYTYDGTTNLLSSVNKPGEDPYEKTSYWYDQLERPALIEHPDGTQEFTKYDILNRPAITGLYSGTSKPGSDGLYEDKSTSGTYKYTTNLSFPTNQMDVITVQHYDNYDLDNDFSDDKTYTAATGYPSLNSIFTRGMAIHSIEAVLEDDGTSPVDYLGTTMFYDDRSRMILMDAQNHLSGNEKEWIDYDFAGRVEKSRQLHTSSSTAGGATSLIINKRWDFDHRGRILNAYHQIGDSGTEKRVANHAYDEWGREKTKKLAGYSSGGGSYTYAQSIGMSYNINGWLTQINDPYNNASGGSTADLFSLKLNYDEAISAVSAVAQYGGNISSVEWKYDQAESYVHTYGMTYDNNSRFVKATYGARELSVLGVPTSTWINSGRYTVDNIAYDDNGNMERIRRYGKLAGGSYGVVDQLYYNYNYYQKDKLESIRDIGNITVGHPAPNTSNQAFTYDDRGNMLSQANRGLTNIQYNHLNLPRRLTNSTGTHKITYRGSGTKLTQAAVGSAPRKDYFSGIEYVDYVPTMIYHEEGRAIFESGKWTYEYLIKDHLGNTRVIFRESAGVPTVKGRNDYYPFGMANEGLSTAYTGSEDNLYRYNGKELNEDVGLYDYGARWYDPSIGRFTAIDPLADQFSNQSPYHYAYNNPLRFIDPDGRSADDVIINGSDGVTYNWIPGEEYTGSDIFIGNVVSSLNALSADPSTANFTFTGRSSTGASLSGNAVLDHAAGGGKASEDIQVSHADLNPNNEGKNEHIQGHVYWDPSRGITEEGFNGFEGAGGAFPPMGILLHEFGHANLFHEYGGSDWRDRSNIFADEEAMIIDKLEGPAMRQLGFGSRGDHFNVRSSREDAIKNNPFHESKGLKYKAKYYMITSSPLTID